MSVVFVSTKISELVYMFAVFGLCSLIYYLTASLSPLAARNLLLVFEKHFYKKTIADL